MTAARGRQKRSGRDRNMEGMVGEREGRRIHTLKVTGEGEADEIERYRRHSGERKALYGTLGLLVFWDGDRVCPGGQMIQCSNRADVDGWGGGAGVGCTLRRKLDNRRRGKGGFRSKLHENKRRSLGSEWSLSKVGKSPPNDSDIPHRLVTNNTHTHYL